MISLMDHVLPALAASCFVGAAARSYADFRKEVAREYDNTELHEERVTNHINKAFQYTILAILFSLGTLFNVFMPKAESEPSPCEQKKLIVVQASKQLTERN